jgi:succinyl-CoA synthetase beta subunit
MDLVEYQGKQLFGRNGVPVPPAGAICRTPDEVEAAARAIDNPMTVIKAQVKMGGRGLAGGVKLAKSPEEARAHAESIFGLDIKGHIVNVIYVEDASDIAEEYYLSILHDRVAKGYLVIASREGGMDIEKVNEETPEKVVMHTLLPSETKDGLPFATAMDIVMRALLPVEALEQAASLLVQLFGCLVAEDATLCEINPLILTTDGRVIALDAKVTLDDNAAFRHDGYTEWDVEGIEPFDEQEAAAKAAEIAYVKLDGDVGILGNGAGLVMASLDVVAQAGGRAANFLDIGGGANAETMAQSLQLVLSDERVNSVLVNVFGGITQCDLVAKGVLGAMDVLGKIDHKLVVRLDGTNAAEGRKILLDANHPNVIPAATMSEAAETAVRFAAERRASASAAGANA